MAKLIALLCVVMSLVACTQNPIKEVQITLDKQLEADNYYAQGDCEKAIPLYKTLSATMTSDTKSLLRLGNCYAKEKDYAQAEQAYQQALSRDNSFTKAWYNLSYVRAQVLADTVMQMYKHVDPNSAEAKKIRELTLQVLAPFGVNLDGDTIEE